MTMFWPSCNCCGCVPTILGNWSHAPTGVPIETDDGEILAVDEFGQIQSVQLAAGATAADRDRGYHVRASFNDLEASRSLPDVDMVSLFLDGGSHEVRLRYESFTAAHSWSYLCQHLVPNTILVQLWRGATLLKETRVANYLGTHGISIDAVFGSLDGTQFCGGFNNNATDVAHVAATTTSSHNGSGCWVVVLDKGGRYHYRTFNGGSIPQSEEIAVTELVLTTCYSMCPQCGTCVDDDSSDKALSVYLPAYRMALFGGGTIDCGGGTFVLTYEGYCHWSHASDNALIYLGFEASGGVTRLKMQVATCLGYTCSGFETPLVSNWYSAALDTPILCNEFAAIELRDALNVNFPAEVSSI